MKLRFAKLPLSGFFLTLCFTLNIAAQTKPFKAIAVADKPAIVKAKREIIKLLLSDIFRSHVQETIYLSPKYIPSEIQNDFPKFKNLTAQFVVPTEDVCLFEFSIFSVSGKKASVVFGDCRSGLGYNFEKVRGKWRFAPLEIERSFWNLNREESEPDKTYQVVTAPFF